MSTTAPTPSPPTLRACRYATTTALLFWLVAFVQAAPPAELARKPLELLLFYLAGTVLVLGVAFALGWLPGMLAARLNPKLLPWCSVGPIAALGGILFAKMLPIHFRDTPEFIATSTAAGFGVSAIALLLACRLHRLWVAWGLSSLLAVVVAFLLSPPAPDLAEPSDPVDLVAELRTIQAGTALPKRKLLFIGIDGCDPDILEELIAQGRLPNIARFRHEGIWGRIDPGRPTLSPIIWNTYASGRPMSEHGVNAFTHFKVPGIDRGIRLEKTLLEVPMLLLGRLSGHKLARRYLVPSGALQSRRMWEMLGDAGRRVGVINWWVTAPAQPFRGRLLGNAAWWAGACPEGLPEQHALELLAKAVHPDSDAAMVFDIYRGEGSERHLLAAEQLYAGIPFDTRPVDGDRSERDIRHEDVAAFSRQVEATRRVASEHDVLFFYDGAVDRTCHQFWQYFEPTAYDPPPSPDEVAAFGEVVPLVYEQTDRMIGELLEIVGPEWGVMLVSDHGFEAEEPYHAMTGQWQSRPISGHHTSAPAGIFAALGPGFARGELAAPLTALEVCPTVLRYLGAPMPSDLQGKPILDLFAAPVRAEEPGRIGSYEIPRASGPLEFVSGGEGAMEQLGYIEGGGND